MGVWRPSRRTGRAARMQDLIRALVACSWVAALCVRGAMDECADEQGRPQRCMPEFVNAAFNVTVEATNTCGSPPEEYCVQTGATGVTKSCHICDARDPRNHHNAAYLTDYNNQQDATWWQSQTMLAGIQYPNSINLTLHLGKAFDITYVRLKFHTSRPESFVIYKRSSEGAPWVPYQYYSGSCEKTYRKQNRGFIRTGGDEQEALCTDDFSDISPLTGGNVAFSTLEGRPSAYNFDHSPVLQDWVTATDIRVTLNRLNTFGDEVFNDPKVLKSYYYAISDLAVGGRCKCNGHASECVRNSGGRLVCDCKHNTDGFDCDVCKPFYNDRPWRRATADNANECLPCDCNGKSSECYFDAELYRATGHGGHCRNCADNTDGPNCERCLDNYYREQSAGRCLPCFCSSIGSESLQCNNRGTCACKPGVTGEKCDRCQPGFHSLTEAGCRPCTCSPSGSTQECDVNTGQCRCKDNVEGFSCDRCKPGYFNLDPSNPQGCTVCFCFQHSSVCESADGYSVHTVSSTFDRDNEEWEAQQRDGAAVPVQWSSSGQEVTLISEDYQPLYFVAPGKFLGNQMLSYGQKLSMSFRVERRDARLSAEDLILEGANMRVAVPLIVQGNAFPNENVQTFVFRLYNPPGNPWRPVVSDSDFQKLLHNLTAIKIRGTYSERSAGYLDDVSLVTARRGPGVAARWVEQCTCPPGYQGQHCEQCTLGYRRTQPELGPFSSCEICNCHGHSDSCHPDTACDCNGKSSECYFDAELYRATGHGGHCRNCADNTDGPNCERCLDNYYREQSAGRCLPCFCSSIGSESLQCNNRGTCACKPGVTGEKCDRCQPGFHSLTEAGCRPCTCSPSGSTQECDVNTGQCRCKDNVEGFSCDRCKPGYFNLDPSNPQGCTVCFCFQHSSVCESADGYSVHTVSSTFDRDNEEWEAQQRDGAAVPVQWSSSGQEVTLISEDYQPLYFVAPGKFLGNQMLSYGQKLSMNFRVERRDARLSAEDLILEGANMRVAVPLIVQGNAFPNENVQTFVFRLYNPPGNPWRPVVSDSDFQKLLHNLTAIKIRGTYSERSAGYLDDVSLVTARRGPGMAARWVEQCTCPPGYQGQHCEQCTLGYRRAQPELGPFSSCEICNCHGHSDSCHPDTGACDCRDNTAGLSCERCKDGFYGNATQGTRGDCQPCPCPPGATCAVVHKTSEVVCTNCPAGTTGKRCELCDDGFFGDPLGQNGPARACRACQCSNNIDPNAVGNCNRETGECLKCIYNTDGFFCDRCKAGFYGNAQASNPDDKCKPCSCSPLGTVDQQTSCSQVTGQCTCLPNVAQRDCSACLLGYFNLRSGNGCERCDCNPIGSTSGECDIFSGQCECHPGVTGLHCDRCEVNFFSFSSSGCKPCDCDPEGSLSGQCKEDGRCECRPGFVGARCDMCEENYFYNRSVPGCQQCPSCYSLVRDKVNQQRQKLQELQSLIDNLGSGQDTVSDKAFEERLKEAEKAIMELLEEAQNSKDADRDLLDRLKGLNNTLTTQWNRLQSIRNTVDDTSSQADRARDRVQVAEGLIDRARQELAKAKEAVSKVDIKPTGETGEPNNMTLLAEEARRLADKHKMDADQIEKIAKDANDTSTKAYNLLLKTLDGESKMGDEIDKLNKMYNDAKDKAKDLEKQADKVQAEAEEAGDKALKLFANLTSLPPFDTKTLEDEAKKIKKEASDLDNLIDKTEREYNDLRDDLKPKELEVRKLLEKGKSEQQTADQLLARVDAAKALAVEAAKKGQSTFKEAESILEDLRDFDKRVNDNKTAAEEAMKKIPYINATIMAANEKTRQAEEALGNAAADAGDAKRKAEEAEKIAGNVQTSSAKTKEDAEKALQDTSKLEKDVNSMMDQLNEAEEELKRKKDEADSDMMMAAMASDNAKQAEDNARKAKSTVKTVLKIIMDLMDQLGNLDKVDLSKLNRIDESLKRAKDKMAGSELDKKLADLNDVASTQKEMIDDYERQIREIRSDIANLNDIKNTLPEGCFNSAALEQP